MKKSELAQIIREEIQNVLKEKAVSQAQQQAAGIALAVKKGDVPASKLRDAGKAMVKMSTKELEKLAGTPHEGLPKKVKKEVSEANEMGAFRRVVIKSSKLDAIKTEIDKLMKRPEIKSGFPMNKFQVKDGAVPGVIVVDMEGQSATGLSAKINDIAKKLDKAADVKIRKELKLSPAK